MQPSELSVKVRMNLYRTVDQRDKILSANKQEQLMLMTDCSAPLHALWLRQQHQISDRLPQVESLIQAFLMFRFHGGPGTSYEDILSSTAVGRDGTKGMLRNR
ncbi:hypothetical protein KCV00_g241, partial [Aureobasidium melanogenum]